VKLVLGNYYIFSVIYGFRIYKFIIVKGDYLRRGKGLAEGVEGTKE
jgi:hypothetical protein